MGIFSLIFPKPLTDLEMHEPSGAGYNVAAATQNKTTEEKVLLWPSNSFSLFYRKAESLQSNYCSKRHFYFILQQQRSAVVVDK